MNYFASLGISMRIEINKTNGNKIKEHIEYISYPMLSRGIP